MKKIFLTMSLVAMVTMMMTSCMHIKLGDHGLNDSFVDNTPTQVHEVDKITEMTSFSKVDVTGPFNVIVQQGVANTVNVKGTVEQLEKMTIYVKNGELTIRSKNSKTDSHHFNGLQVYVTSPIYKTLELTGSGKITAPEGLTADDIVLDLTGSGHITLAKLKCNKLDIDLTGSGEITTGPTNANKVNTDLTGSGSISIDGLTCIDLDNDLTGSGSMSFSNIDVKNANSDVTGSGVIRLNGKVESNKKDVTGSGKVLFNE